MGLFNRIQHKEKQSRPGSPSPILLSITQEIGMEGIPEYWTDSNGDFPVTEDIVEKFKEWGFIIVRGLLDHEELGLLKSTIESDSGLQASSFSSDDGQGRQVRVTIWAHPTDDVTGMIARSEKVAGTFDQLLEDEVYHYHSKMIMKDAEVGGSHIWHQDYGYWYKNAVLFPDMGTVFLPIDDTDRDNGCLQIIPKSHKAGRIDHIRVGDQAGADVERVKYLEETLGLLHVEMKAGDALFFHSNILHRSDQNRSGRRRWAYLIAYNTKKNNPAVEHHHPSYTPLHKLPNSAIKDCKQAAGKKKMEGNRNFISGSAVGTSLPQNRG